MSNCCAQQQLLNSIVEVAGNALKAELCKFGAFGERVADNVEIPEGIDDNIAESMGLKAEAVNPFMVEATSIMLALSEQLISQAMAKLAEADAA